MASGLWAGDPAGGHCPGPWALRLRLRRADPGWCRAGSRSPLRFKDHVSVRPQTPPAAPSEGTAQLPLLLPWWDPGPLAASPAPHPALAHSFSIHPLSTCCVLQCGRPHSCSSWDSLRLPAWDGPSQPQCARVPHPQCARVRPGCLGWPSGVTRCLEERGQRLRSRERENEVAGRPALKTEGEVTGQGMQWPLEAGKSRGTEGTGYADSLTCPEAPTSGVRPAAPRENTSVTPSATVLVVVCHSSHGTLRRCPGRPLPLPGSWPHLPSLPHPTLPRPKD